MAPHSWLSAGFDKSQSGIRFPFRSVHVRVVLLTDVTIGFTLSAYAVVTPCTKRPTLNFSAVLPVPKKTQGKPNRGLMSFQFGALVTASNERAPTNGVAGYVCAGMPAFKI